MGSFHLRIKILVSLSVCTPWMQWMMETCKQTNGSRVSDKLDASATPNDFFFLFEMCMPDQWFGIAAFYSL